MPKYNWRGGISAGTSGAIAGLTLGGPVGAVIGGILGLASAGADEGDIEARMAARKRELLDAIAKAQFKKLETGIRLLTGRTSSSMAQAAAGGARRAAAAGVPGQAESYIAPAQAEIANSGIAATRGYIEGVNAETDRATLAVEQGWADRPMEPSLSDYVTSLGASATKFKQALDRYELEKQLGDDTIGDAALSASRKSADAIVASRTPRAQNLVPEYGGAVTGEKSFGYEGIDPLLENYRRARMNDIGR